MTPHTSHLTPHLTPHPSPLTPHPSPLTRHPSPLTAHRSLPTHHVNQGDHEREPGGVDGLVVDDLTSVELRFARCAELHTLSVYNCNDRGANLNYH